MVACEFSGTVRDAFAARGHDAWSCDLLPSPGQHLQGDVFQFLDRDWDILIAHPPCTYLCSSGLHWNGRVEGRAAQTEAALDFVRALMDAPIPRIAIENPVGCISTRIRPATQYVQPYDFGDDASKRTALWLKGLAPLVADPSDRIAGRIVNGKERWANQCDSGQNRLGPSADRWAARSVTYGGIARAMAEQWGDM